MEKEEILLKAQKENKGVDLAERKVALGCIFRYCVASYHR